MVLCLRIHFMLEKYFRWLPIFSSLAFSSFSLVEVSPSFPPPPYQILHDIIICYMIRGNDFPGVWQIRSFRLKPCCCGSTGIKETAIEIKLKKKIINFADKGWIHKHMIIFSHNK